MSPSIWWLVLGLALCAAEMATGTLFALWFGIAAFLTAIFSYFVDRDVYQYAFFAVTSILLVLLTRRWASRLGGPSARPANVDALVGRTGKVFQVGEGKSSHGAAKVGGEEWRVETEDGTPLKKGMEVIVLSVDGNTLKVKPKP